MNQTSYATHKNWLTVITALAILCPDCAQNKTVTSFSHICPGAKLDFVIAQRVQSLAVTYSIHEPNAAIKVVLALLIFLVDNSDRAYKYFESKNKEVFGAQCPHPAKRQPCSFSPNANCSISSCGSALAAFTPPPEQFSKLARGLHRLIDTHDT